MYAATLLLSARGQLKETAADAVFGLLSLHQKNGQLVDYVCPIAGVDDALSTQVLVPEADSLAPKHSNRYLPHAISELESAGLVPPDVNIGGQQLQISSSNRSGMFSGIRFFA